MPRRLLALIVGFTLLLTGCDALEVSSTPTTSSPDAPAGTATSVHTAPATLAVTLSPEAAVTDVSEPTATQAPSPTVEETLPEPTPVVQEVGTPAPPTEQPEATPTEATPMAMAPQAELVASDLQIPWGLAFAPDGRLFFTERPGRLRVIVDGALREQPVAELPVAAEGEGGLMGLALDPNFRENGYLFVMYTYSQDGALFNRVSRLTVQDETAASELILLEGIPGGRSHDGGAVAFGPDGKLYIGTGDGGQRDLAQEMTSLAGKILRLNPDGSVPDDNPFPGSPIYSFGHRNPQGLAWHPGTGRLYATEHGPSGEMGLCCRDELNLIQASGNYGWPLVSDIADNPSFVDPILTSGVENTWAPSGLAYYGGERLADWRGNLFFGALRGEHLHRIVLSDDGTSVVADEVLFGGEYGRIRAVTVGPDGALYVATSNRDGRALATSGDDRILRIVPVP